MSTEKIREEFEAWYLNKFCGGQARLFRCVNADQVYYFTEVQSKWEAWQASRAAIEVELPKIIDKEWANTHAERSAMREAIGWCKKRIESLGLKVKP